MNRFLEARELARLWSVRVLAVAIALYGFLLALPEHALAVWQTLPPELQLVVPDHKRVALILFVAAGVARALRQVETPK